MYITYIYRLTLKCKKKGIKNLFSYYIQSKYGDIGEKNINAVDDDERTFNYRWPYECISFLITYFGDTLSFI